MSSFNDEDASQEFSGLPLRTDTGDLDFPKPLHTARNVTEKKIFLYE